ncbi:hypothetical protein [Micromonospora sp. HM5-17]|uniref:hypothetical protein n=1 Tax=Micromonospora sp. HM5-17 TaxID=2487710 RepID=UPI000F462F6A|nr:hypothetical protein [Micromonospora sp. HM5-17]ROT28025.1 hypothetical protein EF879_22630 [Micromonospora sp. HM5-17]
MSDDAWREYLTAAQRLDAVRREAATAASEQARSVHAAREELTALRARLVPQQARLRGLGVPEGELTPTEPEVVAAAQAMAGGPEAVRAALRRARASVEAAEAAIRPPLARSFLSRPDTWWQVLVVAVAGLSVLAVLAALCLGGFYLLS